MSDTITVDLIGAYKAGDFRHAQIMMRDLGITYERCEGFSIADLFRFYNCKNVPASLPSYIAAGRKEDW